MLEYIGAPYENLMYTENQYQILAFCSLCSLIMNKKQNLQHVFGLLLEDDGFKEILKEMLDASDDTEVFRTFLAHDHNGDIPKSKYVAKLIKLRAEHQ